MKVHEISHRRLIFLSELKTTINSDIIRKTVLYLVVVTTDILEYASQRSFNLCIVNNEIRHGSVLSKFGVSLASHLRDLITF